MVLYNSSDCNKIKKIKKTLILFRFIDDNTTINNSSPKKFHSDAIREPFLVPSKKNIFIY